MKQYKDSELDNITDKLLKDFLLQSDYFIDRNELIRKYLKMAFCAGYDAGIKPHTSQKPVLKIKDGKVVHRYDSITQTAMAECCDVSTISAAIRKRYGTHQYKGFEYKLEKTI